MSEIIRYIDSVAGDDSWTGEHATNDPAGTGPKQHISAMIDALTYPLTVTHTIKLITNSGSPYTYTETSNALNLSNLIVAKPGVIIAIEPDDWNDSYYNAAKNPSTGAGDLDPTATRSVILAAGIYAFNTPYLELRGI